MAPVVSSALSTSTQAVPAPVNTAPPNGDINDPRVLSGWLVGGSVAIVAIAGIIIHIYLFIRNCLRRRQERKERVFLERHRRLDQQLHERYTAALDDHAKRTAAALAASSGVAGGGIELTTIRRGAAPYENHMSNGIGTRDGPGACTHCGHVEVVKKTSLGRPIAEANGAGAKTSLGRPIAAATHLPGSTTSLGRPINGSDGPRIVAPPIVAPPIRPARNTPSRPTGPIPSPGPQYSTFPKVSHSPGSASTRSPGRQRSATTISNGSSSKLSMKTTNSSAPPVPPLPDIQDKTIARIVAEAEAQAKAERDRKGVPHAITVSGARHTPIMVPAKSTMMAMDNSPMPTDMTSLSVVASQHRGTGTSNPNVDGYGPGASYGGTYGHTAPGYGLIPPGYGHTDLRDAYAHGSPYSGRGTRRLT